MGANLRFTEDAWREHQAKRARWCAANDFPDQRAKADAPPVGPTGHPTGAASSAPIYPLVALCRAMRLAEPVPEYQFCTYRRWRFDYAWPLHMLACECEGGIWTQGRHTRGKGALADLEKYSEAAILGWRVVYCTPSDLATLGIDRVRKALAMTRQAT